MSNLEYYLLEKEGENSKCGMLDLGKCMDSDDNSTGGTVFTTSATVEVPSTFSHSEKCHEETRKESGRVSTTDVKLGGAQVGSSEEQILSFITTEESCPEVAEDREMEVEKGLGTCESADSVLKDIINMNVGGGISEESQQSVDESVVIADTNGEGSKLAKTLPAIAHTSTNKEHTKTDVSSETAECHTNGKSINEMIDDFCNDSTEILTTKESGFSVSCNTDDKELSVGDESHSEDKEMDVVDKEMDVVGKEMDVTETEENSQESKEENEAKEQGMEVEESVLEAEAVSTGNKVEDQEGESEESDVEMEESDGEVKDVEKDMGSIKEDLESRDVNREDEDKVLELEDKDKDLQDKDVSLEGLEDLVNKERNLESKEEELRDKPEDMTDEEEDSEVLEDFVDKEKNLESKEELRDKAEDMTDEEEDSEDLDNDMEDLADKERNQEGKEDEIRYNQEDLIDEEEDLIDEEEDLIDEEEDSEVLEDMVDKEINLESKEEDLTDEDEDSEVLEDLVEKERNIESKEEELRDKAKDMTDEEEDSEVLEDLVEKERNIEHKEEELKDKPEVLTDEEEDSEVLDNDIENLVDKEKNLLGKEDEIRDKREDSIDEEEESEVLDNELEENMEVKEKQLIDTEGNLEKQTRNTITDDTNAHDDHDEAEEKSSNGLENAEDSENSADTSENMDTENQVEEASNQIEESVKEQSCVKESVEEEKSTNKLSPLKETKLSSTEKEIFGGSNAIKVSTEKVIKVKQQNHQQIPDVSAHTSTAEISNAKDNQENISDPYIDFDEESIENISKTIKSFSSEEGAVKKCEKRVGINKKADSSPSKRVIMVKTGSNVERVKRKLEEILEKSKGEEDAAIAELQRMKKEKTDILNAITTEMEKLKSMLVKDKQG